MLSLVKLLASLADAIPALKDIVKDLISMIGQWRASSNRARKHEELDVNISLIHQRMRDAQLRQRKPFDESR